MSKLVLIIIVLVLGGGWWIVNRSKGLDNNWKRMEIGKAVVKVKVRDTMEGRNKGLSGVEKLEENEGMLFVFPVTVKYSFWMKEMKFDLDVLWIKDDKVVEITEGVKAPKNGESPVRFKSEVMVNKVLEVNSGFVKKNGIKAGDGVEY